MRNFLVLAISMLSLCGWAQETAILSESAEISLLTCSPGDNVYEAFGHTAIRVKDETHDLDHAFNYGTFNFNQPNFYFNFTKGRLLYMLSVQRADAFVSYYKYYGRSVTEQVLNLTQAEKQQVLLLLDENLKPENREYLYDYFFDNCSTRPRDLILQALESQVKMDTSDCGHRSIRNLMNGYMEGAQPWESFGINVCLSSSRIDQPATAWEYMYLPEELMKVFDKATVIRESGEVPLVKETRILTELQALEARSSAATPRYVFVGLLLLIAAIVTSFRVRGKSVRILEGTVFLIFGILSLLFLYLWLGTEHYTAHNPYSLLWALPSHLIFAIALFKRQRPVWVRWYSLATAVTMAVLLAGWRMFPIDFPSELRFLVILQLFLAVGIIRSGAKKPVKSD